MHLEFGGLVRVRDAAARHIAMLAPADRAAVFSTSGRTTRDFTEDRAALRVALVSLGPHPMTSAGGLDCPRLTYTQAALIADFGDAQATESAVQAAMACMALPQEESDVAARQVLAAARQLTASARWDARATLGAIRQIVRHIAAMEGERGVVVVSSGFVMPASQDDLMSLIDEGIRGKIVIHTIDARGVFVGGPGAEVRYTTSATGLPLNSAQIERSDALQQDTVLAQMADGTGGVFVRGTNDLAAGFSRAATPAEHRYVLGFSPQNLRMNGKYHRLKVSLKRSAGMEVTARRGYFAPMPE